MSEEKPKLTLDDLLQAEPPISAPLEFREKQACFRLLSRRDREICRFQAMAWVHQLLKENGLDKEYFSSLPAQDAFNNEFELRIIEASLCHAGTRGPFTTMDALRRTITPEEQAYLAARCTAHQDLYDPEKISPELVAECIEEAKKNPIGFDGLLGYGIKTLLISFTTLASGLETSLITESLDGWQKEIH